VKKRKAKRGEMREIVFDDEARREFLTGFRKRKQKRVEEKKAKRKEREKKERLEARKQNRQLIPERAVANAAQVEAACGAEPVGETDTPGPDSEEDMIQEYENEEQLATVTVVEDFDMDALIHPADKDQPQLSEHRASVSKSISTSKTSETSKKKTSSGKKIKYDTRAVRLAEKRKQRARKFEKAARAGGKRSHPSNKRK